jgi:hypothetical protein
VHPNIFISLFDLQITCICHLAVELGSTDKGQRNSLKARALLVVIVVILSLMKNFLDFNSLMVYTALHFGDNKDILLLITEDRK